MTILSKIKQQKNTNRRQFNTLIFGLLCLLPFLSYANPDKDKAAFQQHFIKNFPTVQLQDFTLGIYAIDPESRAKWEETEKYPPYETAIDDGKKLYATPFANGRRYADCLPNKGLSIAHQYPKFNEKTGRVITLPLLINQCRERNKEPTLDYKKGDMMSLIAYLTYSSRGEIRQIEVQNKNAKNAYEKGKRFYYSRRGTLNMACAHCHIDNAGKRLRADIISPALGQVNAFPLYRSAWREMGSLHRRFADCNVITQAKPFAYQSEAYRNLEYFLSYMNNGIKITGPSARQ